MKNLREELTQEYAETIEKLTVEKTATDKKFDEKRKAAKEAETSM
jgi:hypothetical protein